MQTSDVRQISTTPPVIDAVEDAIDLQEIYGVVMGRWPWIVASVVASMLLAVSYLFLANPSYVTDALVQVEGNQNSARAAFAQLADTVSSEIPVSAEIEILRSRLVLGKVVDKLSLDTRVSPSRMPILGSAYAKRVSSQTFGSAPVWLQPFNRPEYGWGGESVTVSSLDLPEELLGVSLFIIKGEGDKFLLTDAAYRPILNGVLGALAIGKVNDEEISIFVQKLVARPGTAFNLVRTRREAAIASLKGNLTATASRTAPGIVTLQFKGQNPQKITRILSEILNIYQTQNIDRRSAEAEKTLNFLNKQLPELRKEVEENEARLNQFKIVKGTADLTQETASVLQRSVELDQARGVLNQKRTEALQRFTENHPVVEAIDSQVAQLDLQIAKVIARVRQLPDIEQKALQLTRDLQVSSALYVSLLNRTQELEVVKSGTIGSIRIVDLPVVPVSPSAPNKPLIMGLSLILSLVIGFVLVFLLNALNSGVEDPHLVEQKLGLPTYGTIPYSAQQGKLSRLMRTKGLESTILAVSEPTGQAMEAIRSLRTALHFAQMDAANNILMLTGPEPSLGKTFVSINLGAALANAGRKVVVVDADMRRGHLHKMVFQSRNGGLSELISGSINIEDCLKPTQVPNLFVITTGVPPPNPSELLINERFVEMLRVLSGKFDHVIIDTPPVLAVTDAAIIGRHAATTLLVLKAGMHSMRMIEEAANRLRRAGVEVRGTLFNQVGRSRSGKYGYKYGYYYGGYKYNYSTQLDK